MMKLVSCLIWLSILVSACPALGAQVGNISDPAALSEGRFSGERAYAIMAGIESDFVTDKRFDQQTNRFSLNYYGMKIGSVIRDFLYVYGTFGMGQIKDKKQIYGYDPPAEEANVQIQQVDIDSGQQFIYGLGVTAIMHEAKLDDGVFFRIGVDAKYRRISFDTNDVRIHLANFNVTEGSNQQIYPASYAMNINEFQGAVVASFQYEKVSPYVGYRISDWNGDEELVVNSFTEGNINYYDSLETNGLKGYFIGITYYFSNTFSINMEGRERDEEAWNMSVQMRF